MSELSSVPLAGPGAAAGPWGRGAPSEHSQGQAFSRHFPFPGLHYLLEWGGEGLRARSCVLLPGEESSQAGGGKLGCEALVGLGGWEPGSPRGWGAAAAPAPLWSHPWLWGMTSGIVASPRCRMVLGMVRGQLSGSQILRESALHVGVEGAQNSCKKVLILPPGQTPHGSVLCVLLIPSSGLSIPTLCVLSVLENAELLLHRVGDTAWGWQSCLGVAILPGWLPGHRRDAALFVFCARAELVVSVIGEL